MSSFDRIRNGYDPQQVDRYISEMNARLSTFETQNEAISNALINAQMAADNIIANAEIAASEIRGKSIEQLNNIALSVEEQRQMVLEFRKEYNDLTNKYIKRVEEEDFDNIFRQIEILDGYINKLKKDQENSIATEDASILEADE